MFSLSTIVRAAFLAAAAATAAQAAVDAPQSFYTVTAEIALARHQARAAALQYAAAARQDPALLPRAVEVAADTLQPTIELALAQRWITADPAALEAERAAASAALSLHKITIAAGHFRTLLTRSPLGLEAEFDSVERSLREADNVYGARQVADRLAGFFPSSPAARRLQGYTALRADDPAAAARSFREYLQAAATDAAAGAGDARRELVQTARRARILAGDVEAPLAEARAELEHADSPAGRLDYSLLLLSAKRDHQALDELARLQSRPEAAPDALRLMGLIEFQSGDLDSAATRFAALLAGGHYADDALYYLGSIAERHADFERALTLYARVQGGENGVAALLRAASILRTHGEAASAEDLLNQLLQEEPQRAPAILAARAQIDLLAGDAARAGAVLDAAVAEYPDSADLAYAHASNLEERGRVDAALRELEALVRARPDDPAALNALGYTLADHSRRLTLARRLIDRAHAAAPKSAAIRDSVGWVLFRQGHAAEALPFLSEAYADEPGGDIGAHLGEVLWHLGKHAEAEHVWSEAGALDSDSRLLKATRQRLRSAQ